MIRKCSIALAFSLAVVAAHPQATRTDTAMHTVLTDTSIIDYDELFRDFDAFMDSILMPPTYFIATMSLSKGYFNFEGKSSTAIQTTEKLAYSPLIGYFHRNGLGITGTGYMVDDNTNMNFYQFALTPSFDMLHDRRFAAGLSYTRYFTKDSLPFYTTPIQNELYAYFMYRKLWFKPAVTVNYGWGSRTEYEERELLIQDLRLRRRGFTYINTKESVSDFSVTASVRHDFYWLDVFTGKDHIRFTPQVAFTSGTQKFGFNQSSNTYATLIRTGSNILFSSESVYLDDELDFQPLSLTAYLRGEYAVGKFFIQPQLAIDYYFPAKSRNLTGLFSLNLGFIF